MSRRARTRAVRAGTAVGTVLATVLALAAGPAPAAAQHARPDGPGPGPVPGAPAWQDDTPSAGPAAAGPRPDFRAPWPCGQERQYYHHATEVVNAIDFNLPGSADLGTPALATAPGTVVEVVSGHAGYGNYVRVDHGGGWTTIVAHLSAFSVGRGQVVAPGRELGKVGSTGNSSGPHLHYEQEANGVNQPVVVDGVALRYSEATSYHTSGNCGGGHGVFGGSPTDFTGDGRDDIVTFTQNSLADVYLAPSTGTAFGASSKAHDFFALSGETPLTGDFNGDGKDDIVTFTHGSLADVHVALSNGTSFGAPSKWHDFFAVGGEVPAVGDFNGDGKDDIATFTRGSLADVYVSLSDGTKFVQSQWKWHDFFAVDAEYPAVGDVDGDGRDDIVVFTRGAAADVHVARSTGSSFGASVKAHDFFALGTELPRIGDVDGDGRDDIVTFTNNDLGDVYVAMSNGATFGPSAKANEFFAPNGEFPYLGDYNGDGKDDIVTFTQNSLADVHVAVSNGSVFVSPAQWHDFFGLPGERAL